MLILYRLDGIMEYRKNGIMVKKHAGSEFGFSLLGSIPIARPGGSRQVVSNAI
jgi:hypothetical protein